MRKLLTNICLTEYNAKQRYSLTKHLKKFEKYKHQSSVFAFTQSSVFSSLIEGSGINLDSYLFNKETGYKSKEMSQIEDLIKAYQFAKGRALTYKNVWQAHKIISDSFDMQPKYKGVVRDKEVRVGNLFKTVYTGTEVKFLDTELATFFKELNALVLKKNYTYNEAFYYASMVHLVFVKIHPFADGNGRLSRLLEKWVLAKLIGDIAWTIPSEVNYWIKRDTYYKNLGILGKTYNEVDYRFALPFLLMLPTSFGVSKRYYS
jgi:Fic family protein